ncbi:hypothetical protein CTA1_3015 [Colletotrichum tanaceti]|uniref:Uncharacterized protein n=1 Tax=Colletotrichum tanaceti TaxID=1306861 RepID=A0A4U6X0S6_9PEZI|nr:hypothetical protein CTA1_3015 [Colletotrichum tanaceti]
MGRAALCCLRIEGSVESRTYISHRYPAATWILIGGEAVSAHRRKTGSKAELRFQAPAATPISVLGAPALGYESTTARSLPTQVACETHFKGSLFDICMSRRASSLGGCSLGTRQAAEVFGRPTMHVAAVYDPCAAGKCRMAPDDARAAR